MRGTALLILVAVAPCFAAGDKAVAKTAFERGVKAYNLGEYQAARDAFTDAYNEIPNPLLLYNLAQSWRMLGTDKAKAVTLYRSYLRELPDAANSDEVKRIIATLETEIVREQAAKRSPPQGVEVPATPKSSAPSVVPAAVAKPTPPRPWWRNSAGWALGGTGLALAVVGAGLAGAAVATEGDARTASMLQTQRDLHSRANALEAGGWVVLGIGGAGVVAGVAVLAAGNRRAEVH